MSSLPPPAPGTGPYPGPAPKTPARPDPLTVALGNASLLGLGYFLMRRWKTGIAALLVTAVLVVVLVVQKESSYELAIVVWWAVAIVHGWFLAQQQPNRTSSLPKRLVALGLTVAVLLAVGVLRFGAARIDDEAVAARNAGDCAGVSAAKAKYSFGHRLADAPRTVRVEGDVGACDRLDSAAITLRTATRTGDPKALDAGFGVLSEVLAEPGQEHTVSAVLDGFLRGLPAKDPCATVALTAALRFRDPTHNLLDGARAVVPRLEPNALLGCGDARAAAGKWDEARVVYQQLADNYPRAKQAVKARAGAQRAALTLELNNVRGLITSGEYCSSPAKYGGAAPYHRRGVNRALFVGGTDEYTGKLPSQWRTTDPYRATLMLCTEENDYGTAVETCPYTPIGDSYAASTSVTFYKIAVPVKAYELRTGRLVMSTTVQIGGSSCPQTIYTSYTPSQEYVTPTSATVQAAFKPILAP
ncbi:hypothetical protein AB0L70_27280 [Kribbella sp. NPDC051952]|uniref:tetratricopeptide repeat protein n=1 Tax=Kribbella sp. NPDC051952 TaxID=3154851 RepID=UPI00343BB50F